jgi:chromosome segregation ATPase
MADVVKADDAKGGGFLDKLVDSLIEKGPDILMEGGKQIMGARNQSDTLKTEEKKLQVQLAELEEEIRNNKEDAALQREKMQLQLALEAIKANIAAAEDREFEALQRMEQQKMSRAVAGDVTSALGQIVAGSQAGIK